VNRLTNPVLLLVPHEALGAMLVLFLVLGGLCRVVGARRASTGLIATAIAIPFATVVVEALFNELFGLLPPSLVTIVAWFVMIIVYLFIFGALMRSIFGEDAWSNAMGQLIANSIQGILRFAFSWPLILVWGVLAFYLWIK